MANMTGFGSLEKQTVHRDQAYLDWIRTQDCLKCGTSGPGMDAAHMRTGQQAGMGRKPSDTMVAPLCRQCHTEQEANPGADWWMINVVPTLMGERYQQWRGRRA